MLLSKARLLPLLALSSMSSVTAWAQDPPVNVSLVGNFDEPGSVYADVWGEGNLAFLAHKGQSQVDIVDISNPANPQLEANYFPQDFGITQDVKSAGGLMFVGREAASTGGCEIVDVRNPSNPQFLTLVNPGPGNFESAHNIFYEAGWLYMVNSFDATVAIVDLRNYDPDNAPANITSLAYRLDNVGTQWVHDITVQNGRLYAAGWSSLEVYDVSNLGTSAPTLIGSVLGTSCHSSWPTADGEWLVTNEERQGGTTRLYEVIPVGGGNLRLEQRDSWVVDANRAYTSHNSLIVGDRVYIAHNGAGFVILEIDRSSGTLEEVASYDTFAGAGVFDGVWGVYPFLGLDKVLGTDREDGLHVFDASAIQIGWPGGRPALVQPLGTDTITVELTELGNAVIDPGAVQLHARVEGGGTISAPMSSIRVGHYQAALPAANCGEKIEYWVTATTTGGKTYSDPVAGVNAPHEVFAASGLSTTFFDDFTGDQGWGVQNQNLSGGAWERVAPNADGAGPDRDDPAGAGTRAFVTGQAPIGSTAGASDVDGGPTTLFSPFFSLSGDALISYSRWFYNNNNDGDSLEVEITRGDGWKRVETVVQKAGGWVKHTFRVSDFVAPGNGMRMRFRTSDNPNNAATEAGLDEFLVQEFQCQPQASSVSRNGTGANPNAYVELAPSALGTTWMATVDIATPGAVASFIAMSSLGQALVPTGFGELLIDISGPFAAPINVGAGAHNIGIPADASLLGTVLYTQAATFAPGDIRFQNAIDLTLGY